MAKSIPINDFNAIEAAAFVIVFDRSFTEKEQNKLLSLQKELADDLPVFQIAPTFDVKEQMVFTKTGVVLKKIDEDGKDEWVLRTLSNQISIICTSYRRWETVWSKAEKYLLATAQKLDLENLKIEAVVLQYADKFVGDAADYHIHDVFAKKNKYLTKQAEKAGRSWHVHQGWFEAQNDSERVLNVLNLTTNAEQEKVISRIEHEGHIQYAPEMRVAKNFFDSKTKEYEKTFAFLHQNNKNVVSSVLSEEQKTNVGINA
jgi:hypothetical protein